MCKGPAPQKYTRVQNGGRWAYRVTQGPNQEGSCLLRKEFKLDPTINGMLVKAPSFTYA